MNLCFPGPSSVILLSLQGNILPLRASSHDHPVREVQTHSSEVSRVPALQELYTVAIIRLQCALQGAAV